MRTEGQVRAKLAACALAICLGALPLWQAHGADDERRSDLWLKAALITTYTLNQQLNPFDIDVQVTNGVAELQGVVDSSVEKDLATELARGVDGIESVDNRLQVKKGAVTDGSRNGLMERVNDANLTAKVKSQLLWNSNTQGLRIDVDTDDSTVTLSGEVASAAESELAEQIARNTSGVLAVRNELQVNTQQAPVAKDAEHAAKKLKGELSDAWISAKVKSSLLYNRGVDAASIEVQTHGGVVTLSGEVHSQHEFDRAAQVAGAIVGVSEVRNRLRISAPSGA